MRQGAFCAVASVALTIPLSAQVITYDLTYSSGGSSTLVGQATVDTSDPGASASTLPGSGLPSWLQALTFTYNSGGTMNTYSRSDFTGIVWTPSGSVNWSSDLVPQFGDINFFGSQLNGVDPFVLAHVPSGDQFTLTSMTPVPEPWHYSLVAAFGVLAFAGYRRISAGQSTR